MYYEDDDKKLIKVKRKQVMKEIEKDTKFFSDCALGPYAAWVNDHRGAAAELARRMSKILNKDIRPPHICRWINKDPDKRVEPSLGYGVLMIDLIRKMQNEYRLGHEAYTTGPIAAEVVHTLPPVFNDEGEPESPAETKGLVWTLETK